MPADNVGAESGRSVAAARCASQSSASRDGVSGATDDDATKLARLPSQRLWMGGLRRFPDATPARPLMLRPCRMGSLQERVEACIVPLKRG
jgi:hypothetical protein